MVSNTGSRSIGELLIIPRTSEVALSRPSASLSSREVAVCCASLSLRVSSAFFFLSLVWEVAVAALRRDGLIVLRRFVFRPLVRPVVTQFP